jgi:hypothetical protein
MFLDVLSLTQFRNGACQMTGVVDAIRRRLQRYGWSARDANFATLGGGTLWLVSVRRKGQSFSAQGETQREAWKLAWRLGKQLHLTEGERVMVVPFRGRLATYSRAG